MQRRPRWRPAVKLNANRAISEARDPPQARSTARGLMQLLFDRSHLVLKRLGGSVDALVDLHDRVDTWQTGLERDVVQLANDVEDVVERPLELGAHRMQLKADFVLALKAPVHLGDVLTRAGGRTPKTNDRYLGGCQRSARPTSGGLCGGCDIHGPIVHRSASL